ncbi:MAG: OmpA family protein [Candidatus Aminicenantes bacterium]|nr:OmpA family protein [Candidatus Aminicenantes bacterium]
MKKISFTFVFLLIVINLVSQKIDTSKGYVAYLDEPLMIAETDLICSYFITRRISEDIRITGSQEMDFDRVTYIDNDKLFINKGSLDGYKVGDMFIIIAKGKKIRNPFTSKKLGTYFLKKSLAVISCIFENTAVITLRDSCAPVELTDIALPYKKENTLRKKRIDYKRCVLPRSPVEGNVVYTNLYMDIVKNNTGAESYITIDIGKAFVSKGDFVLFYKNFKKKLPPLIIGSGVVINPQNTNSTIRIIESALPVNVGTKVVLMPEIDEKKTGKDIEDEVPLIIDALEDMETTPVEEKTLELNLLFNLDEKVLTPEQHSEIIRVKEFINSASKYRVILRGYTCSIGGMEYNLKLSQERVENIKNLLIKEFNLDESLIDTYYYGEKDTPFDNTTEEQRRKNRAVNIQVIGK